MLRLDRVGTVRRGIAVAPKIDRYEGEADESFERRSASARMLEGVTIDVVLCDRAVVLEWNEDAMRAALRFTRSDAPVSEAEYREMRAGLRRVVAAGVAGMHGVEVGGVDLASLSGEALAAALDECSLPSLLADVAGACRRAQVLSDVEKKASESSQSRAASGSQTGAQ